MKKLVLFLFAAVLFTACETTTPSSTYIFRFTCAYKTDSTYPEAQKAVSEILDVFDFDEHYTYENLSREGAMHQAEVVYLEKMALITKDYTEAFLGSDSYVTVSMEMSVPDMGVIVASKTWKASK